MTATIKDIADRAEVSPSTVSRVLNRSGYVREETRARVENAIEDLQYRPSWIARSLRGKRSALVGLIIPDILNVYYDTVAKAILEHLHKAGFSLVIQISNEDPDLELAYLYMLQDRKVDGIIRVPVDDGANSELVHQLVSEGMAMVEVNRQRESDLLDAVLADNVGGGYVATEHVLRLGHRRVALLCGAAHLTTARDRLAGYRKALEDCKVPFDPDLVKMQMFSKEWGVQATRELLELGSPPTAIFAGSNRILIGTMTVLAERGLRVPEDISVIAFDDSEWLSFWQPPITSVDIAVDEMGALAVQLLLRRIESGRPSPKPVTYRLSVDLVERQSCRRV